MFPAHSAATSTASTRLLRRLARDIFFCFFVFICGSMLQSLFRLCQVLEIFNPEPKNYFFVEFRIQSPIPFAPPTSTSSTRRKPPL
jgi:hypothetical protein